MATASSSRRTGDVRLWRPPHHDGVELLHAAVSEFVFRPHSHGEFFIALTERGLAVPTLRGAEYVVRPGDLLVLNPEEAHSGGPPDRVSWEYRALYLQPGLVRDVLGDLPGDRLTLPDFTVPLVRDHEVGALLRRFHRLSARPEASLLQRDATLHAALVLLISRHTPRHAIPRPPGREQRAVRMTREFLDAHAAEEIPLKQLERVVGLSRFQLCRAFHDVVGMTPHAYQIQARVRRAMALLAEGLPIALAAAEAGFYDQAHLTRQFLSVVGLTPARYVRMREGPSGTPSGLSAGRRLRERRRGPE